MHKELRAVQIAAYFLWIAQKPLEYKKLIQLMYLSEREYLLNHGSLLTGDGLLCERRHPILAKTENAFNSLENHPVWNTWLTSSSTLSTRGHRFFSLRRNIRDREVFDRLSGAMLKVLDETYTTFSNSDSEILSDLNQKRDLYPECYEPNENKGVC
ncbi:MAG: hypothetical protein LUC43_05940 [Burkholderiales bacterium]|nr:hypothetical protein [Burkholderiales bacterium]